MRRSSERRPLSIGLLGNAADDVSRDGAAWRVPDMVTDQTSAHDPFNGYVPVGYDVEEAAALRASDPEEYVRLALASMAIHVRAMLDMQKMGAVVVRLRQQHSPAGLRAGGDKRLRLSRLRARLHSPALLRGQGAIQVGRVIRRPRRHLQIDDMVLREFADNKSVVAGSS